MTKQTHDTLVQTLVAIAVGLSMGCVADVGVGGSTSNLVGVYDDASHTLVLVGDSVPQGTWAVLDQLGQEVVLGDVVLNDGLQYFETAMDSSHELALRSESAGGEIYAFVPVVFSSDEAVGTAFDDMLQEIGSLQLAASKGGRVQDSSKQCRSWHIVNYNGQRCLGWSDCYGAQKIAYCF